MEEYKTKLLVLEQEVHNCKEQCEKDIETIQTKLVDIERRILSMERSKEKTDFQYEQIMEMLNKINNVTIPNLTTQIEELKNKPAKRYDQAISGVLGAVFGAVGGYIVSLFIK